MTYTTKIVYPRLVCEPDTPYGDGEEGRTPEQEQRWQRIRLRAFDRTAYRVPGRKPRLTPRQRAIRQKCFEPCTSSPRLQIVGRNGLDDVPANAEKIERARRWQRR